VGVVLQDLTPQLLDVVAHGVYAVDFTVTDPDGLSDSAALLPARQPGWSAGQPGGLTGGAVSYSGVGEGNVAYLGRVPRPSEE